jgi:outer membrane protein OmpA-like peptidoglycan-associated protein
MLLSLLPSRRRILATKIGHARDRRRLRRTRRPNIKLNQVGTSAMSKFFRIPLVLLIGALAAGCANQGIKPATILCPLMGGAAGAAVAVGFHDEDEATIAAGAVLGAAAGYFLCREEPTAAPAPAPTPAAAPAPAPKPVAEAPKDSDGDGVIDPNDKCPGTPPGVKVNAEGCPEVGTTLMSLHGVNFDTDSAKLKAESTAILDQAADVLNQQATVSVRIEGHTDSRGSDAYNQVLSDKRAKSVMDYLVGKGVAAARLTSAGFGESKPVVANDSAANMARNRRVDLVVTNN